MPYGPCSVCGTTNYPNSMGGPSICPSCDCGNFDGQVFAWNNAKLNTELIALRTRLEALEKWGREVVIRYRRWLDAQSDEQWVFAQYRAKEEVMRIMAQARNLGLMEE